MKLKQRLRQHRARDRESRWPGELVDLHPPYTTAVVFAYPAGMTAKVRLSVTVDLDLLEAVHADLADGAAESLSAWVNDALRLKLEHNRRLRGLDDFITAYEAEHGVITEEEMDAAIASAKARAITVRDGRAWNADGTEVA